MSIATSNKKILDKCHKMVNSHLTALMDRMFENADVGFLDFADKAESNAAQALFFEAMAEVRKKRPDVERLFHKEVMNSFNKFPEWSPDSSMDEEDEDGGEFSFSLVKDDIMEEDVAIKNILTKNAGRVQENLNALVQRLSVINDGDAITEIQIPAGPSVLANAFRLASHEMEMETKVWLVMIALFDKFVLGVTGLIYSEYNELLIQEGILPKLKYKIHKSAAGSVSNGSVQPDDTPEAVAEEQYTEPGSPDELGQELFGNICGYLANRHPSAGSPAGGMPAGGMPAGGMPAGGMPAGGMPAGGMPAGGMPAGGMPAGGMPAGGMPAGGMPAGGMPAGGMPAGGMPAGGMPAGGMPAGGMPSGGMLAGSVSTPANGPVTGIALAPAESLVGSINQMQGHVQAGQTIISNNEFIENIKVDENLVTTLQQTLFEERQKIFGAVDRRKIPTADSDVIDLVGMLFEYMLKEEQLPSVVKALISRIHTPMLKVAILDRRFFTQSKHPARRLMNDMISAGIRWVNDKNLDAGIFPRMREIVNQLLMDFEEDVNVFEHFRIAFEKISEETKKRSEVVEKRTNETANGQEKLMAARKRAHQEIRLLLGGKAMARASCNILTKLWTDKMIFILLREANGDQSESWTNASSMAKKIVASASPPDNEDARLNRVSGLDDLQQEIRAALSTTQHAEKEALLLALFEAQKEVLAPNLDEMSAEIMVETPVAEVAPEPEVEPEIASETLSTEQQAALEKISDLPFGTWFDFKDDSTGKPKRAKLSWRSTITKKYMFVDQMGVKSVVISMTDLACALVNGSAEIIVHDKKPFVDRALGAIHRMLDRGVTAA